MGGHGGARIGAGRPPGSKNFSKQQAALMRATPRGRRKRLAIDVLRRRMFELDDLATEARKANDPAYTRWAKAAAELAVQLAQYETPRLGAVAVATAPAEGGTVNFELRIFESQRQPKVKVIPAPDTIEVTAAPASEQPPNGSAPSNEGAAAAKPDATNALGPPPDSNGGADSRPSLYMHPFFNTWREPLIRGGMTRGGRG